MNENVPDYRRINTSLGLDEQSKCRSVQISQSPTSKVVRLMVEISVT